MKKQYFCATLVLISSSAISLEGESNSEIFQLEEKIACISDCNVQNQLQGKITSSGIDCGFTTSVSFLYQQGVLDNLSSVKEINQNPVNPQPNQTIEIRESIDNIHFDWRPGVRVSLGYIFSQRDQFGIDLAWTYLEGKGKSSTSLDSSTLAQNYLKPSWLPFLLGSVADQAQVDWNCKLNLLDGVMGRSFFLGRWLTFYPYGGVRGVWIDQDYQAKYHAAWTIDTTGSGDLALSIRDTKFKGKNDFHGVGLLFGFQTEWYLSCQFSTFANLKTSLNYGRFKIDQFFDGQIVIPIPGIPTLVIPETIDEKRNFHRIRPSLEGEIGLRWEQFFCQDCYRFSLGASYQFSYWFSQNLFENVINVFDPVQNAYVNATIDPRSLQFQGVNIQVGFDF